jgi:hypothetical protein
MLHSIARSFSATLWFVALLGLGFMALAANGLAVGFRALCVPY